MTADQSECVLDVQALELNADDQLSHVVLHHLEQVVRERDSYASTIADLSIQHNDNMSSSRQRQQCNGDDGRKYSPDTTTAVISHHRGL